MPKPTRNWFISKSSKNKLNVFTTQILALKKKRADENFFWVSNALCHDEINIETHTCHVLDRQAYVFGRQREAQGAGEENENDYPASTKHLATCGCPNCSDT